jgi:hypothetical protein
MNIEKLFESSNLLSKNSFNKQKEETLNNLYKILQSKLLDKSLKKSEKYTFSLIQIMKDIDLELDIRKLNKKS